MRGLADRVLSCALVCARVHSCTLVCGTLAQFRDVASVHLKAFKIKKQLHRSGQFNNNIYYLRPVED